MAKLRASDAEISRTLRPVSEGIAKRKHSGQYRPAQRKQLALFPVAKLTLAQSKREETAAALKELTDQALREVALAYD